jgi:1-acyl-sn-glycerol-3-phosphate acyltransferase
MAEHEPPTVEFRTSLLPARADDLREQLPGLEPDRRITDWGRSERIEGLADRVVYDFLYRYWFRVEVEGIENVPVAGGALLMANHAGGIPPDGAMIAKAIREEHPSARVVHVLTARSLASLPLVGMIQSKLGRIQPHPANVHRLLFDEDQLVLAFPEGPSAAAKPVKERYRLRGFESTGLIDAALKARAPVVPVAVLGAEEAVPVLARIPGLRRVMRIPRVPIAVPIPLPAKFRIRFLEPIDTAQVPNTARRDPELVAGLAEDIRALIQENLLELVAERRSAWL